MPRTPLTIDDERPPRPRQDIDEYDVDGQDLMDLLSMYDPYGIWRIDLETGKVHWSPDVYQIHGLDYTEGVVDLNAALAAYHPEDAKMIAQLLEETITKKTGYRFVLRLKKPDGSYKMVKSIAKYRINRNGKAEIYGLFSEFQMPIRNIAAH